MLIDAAKIAANCDGTLLVVTYNQVRKQELIDAQQHIEQSGCPILGTVITQADFGDYVGRKYYYGRYYGSKYGKYSQYYTSSEPEKKTTKKSRHSPLNRQRNPLRKPTRNKKNCISQKSDRLARLFE